MAVGCIRIDGQIGQMVLHLVIDVFTRPLEQRLIKIAIPHLTGQVAERSERSLRYGDHPVEQGAEGFLSARSQERCALQTSFKNPENWCNLLLHSLVRLADPEE